MFPLCRYNDGQYPHGFYQFYHLFAGHGVEHSVWVMRSIDVGIAMVLIDAAYTLSAREMRRAAALAAFVAWTPTGLYFIASNNPSS